MSAKKFITDNGAEVHDRVRIENGDLTYEGLILPKHNFSEDNIIIIKLDNGYNIGISTENAKMTLISKAEKKDTVTHSKKENKELPEEFLEIFIVDQDVVMSTQFELLNIIW